MARTLIALALGLSLTTVTGVVVAATDDVAAATGQAASLSTVLSTLSADAQEAYARGVIDIVLGDPITVSGEGATVTGTTVTITAAGVYHISGVLPDGQIEVDAKGKVCLEFDGVDVTSSAGPALLITDAKKVTLTLAEGTANNLADAAGEGDYDAALFTNDTLVINGDGALVVTGNDNEGISSDDDIVINSGTLKVTAVDDALNAHDDITINGGEVQLVAGGDGVDSNGTVHVNGGSLVSFGGLAGGDGGLDAVGAFIIAGGTVVAGGNSVAAPDADSSQCSLCVSAPSVQAAGTAIIVTRNAEEVFSCVPGSEYQNVLVSSSDLIAGATHDVYFGTAKTPISVVAAITPAGTGVAGDPTAAGGL